MQLNAGLERLDDIGFDSTNDDLQNKVQETKNQFIMYSILDELQLNDSQKPMISNIVVPQDLGYTGCGFISHIENELIGTIFLMDIQSMPDPIKLFGAKPQRLTEQPKPGEMFGYVFQEKYLVRAVRLEYESFAITKQTQQYSALLIDIGCTIRIDIKPTLTNHYAVTNDAKIIPAYSKHCQLVNLPPNTNLGDLLHTSVKYRVNCVDKHLTFVSILDKGKNPFAAEHHKEWHFYLYFLGNHINLSSLSYPAIKYHSVSQSKTVNVCDDQSPSKYDEKLNPFADSALYKIKSIPTKLVLDKNNPFYFDLMDNLDSTGSDKPIKSKLLNFQLTKVFETPLNSRSDNSTLPVAINKTNIIKACSTNEEKILNQTFEMEMMKSVTPVQVCKRERKIEVNVESNLKQNHSMIDKPVVNSGRLELLPSLNSSNNHSTECTKPAAIQQIIPSKPAMPLNQQKPVILPQIQNQLTSHCIKDFVKPTFVPTIGGQIQILYQTIENVETFYGVIVNDPTRDMQVHEFSIMLNDDDSTKHLIAYGDKETPELFETVLALYEDQYFRAKVISVIDSHTFHVFYVDYGNVAKLNTTQIFKYDSKWNSYPVYAVHFRINGIKETNRWDYRAKAAIEQIMIANCDAIIIDIEYHENTKRTTYVVDVYDENGLSVAETLIHKNFALYTGKRPNQSSSVRRRQPEHA